MKCNLMGRCGTSLISFPSIWGWSKDQELPRQVTQVQGGNKCRRIWNSQGFRRNSCFPSVSWTEELHVFPWKPKKKKKSEMWLWDAQISLSKISAMLCVLYLLNHIFFNPNFVACCGRGWSEPGRQGTSLCILTTLLDVILQVAIALSNSPPPQPHSWVCLWRLFLGNNEGFCFSVNLGFPLSDLGACCVFCWNVLRE